jgi:DNA repair protein RecN (Recombination protein N)
MLRYLAVRHLAVIDHLEVEFEPGLNVLTGETGAGKSILVEAIDLLLGSRASADLVRTGEQAATIQAIFEDAAGLDVIVRREISAQGRSRAFVNDALATAGALRELGTTLLDLHGQHEHQTLLDPAQHVLVLDAFGGLAVDAAAVAERFSTWQQAAGALERTRLDDREKRARIDMATFQLQEIETVAPTAGEDERLAGERVVLANADRLQRLSHEAYAALYDDERAALTSLSTVWKRLEDLAAIDPQFATHLAERDDVKSRLEDLAIALRSYATDLDASPERLQQVEDRLAALERLKRKHGPALADVIARQDALRDELEQLGASGERAERLDRMERELRSEYAGAAGTLSSARSAAASRLASALAAALAELAMPQADVAVRVIPSQAPDRWTARGLDDVELFLSANPGEDPRPLARIASGGELSRVMLALRTLAMPEDSSVRTLVFDEVDAGIGGAAADAVGARLQALANRYQVLCVTHLPQIAARGDTHFQIAKSVRGGRTLTTVTRLDPSGRVGEIGRMIAGAEVSADVLASAKDLMTTRARGEAKAKGESEGPARAKAKDRPRGA